MVDTVKIDELQVAAWAKEETLKKLVTEARVTNDVLAKFVGDKLSKEQLDELRKGHAIDRSTNTALKTWMSRQGLRPAALSPNFEGITTGVTGSITKAMTQLTGGSSGVMNFLQTSVSGASQGLLKFGNIGLPAAISNLVKFTGHIGLVVSASIGLYEELTKLIPNFAQLYNTGVRFNDGLVGLSKFAGDLGITGANATKILTQFSATIAVMGTAKAQQLGKQFLKITNYGSDLLYSQEDATEAAYNYAEMLRGTGTLGSMSINQLATNALSYNKELLELSEVTGKDRKALEDHTKSLLKAPDVQGAIRALPTELRDAMPKISAQFAAAGDPGDIFRNFILSLRDGPQKLDKEFSAMLTQTGSREAFENIQKQAAQGKDVTQALEDFQAILTNPDLNDYMQTFIKAQGLAGQASSKYNEILTAMIPNQEAQKQRIQDVIDEYKTQQGVILSETQARRILTDQAKQRQLKETAVAAATTASQNKLSAISGKLSAIYERFVIAIGPSLVWGVNKFGDFILKSIRGLEILIDVVPGWLDKLGISQWWSDSMTKMTTDWAQTWEDYKSVASITADLMKGIWTHLTQGVIDSWEWVKEKMTGTFTKIGEVVDWVISPFKTFGEMISNFITKLREKLPWLLGVTPAEAAEVGPTSVTPAEATEVGAPKPQGESMADTARSYLSDTAKAFYNWATTAPTKKESTPLQEQQLQQLRNLANSVSGLGGSIPALAQTLDSANDNINEMSANTKTMSMATGGLTDSLDSATKAAPAPIAIQPAVNQTAIVEPTTTAKTPAAESAAPGEAPSLLSQNDLNDATMKYYQQVTQQSSITVQLLSDLNQKLEELNQNVRDQTSDLSRSIDGVSGVIH